MVEIVSIGLVLFVVLIGITMSIVMDIVIKDNKIKAHLNVLENLYGSYRTFVFTLSGPEITERSRSEEYKLTIEQEVALCEDRIAGKFSGVKLPPLLFYHNAYLNGLHYSHYTGDLFAPYGVDRYEVAYLKRRWFFKHYYYFVFVGFGDDSKRKMAENMTVNLTKIQAPLLAKLL